MEQPPVVLVHGTGSTFAHNWGAQGWPELLADSGREVIPGRLPGHGPDPVSPAVEAADLLLQTIAGREPVDAIGFSAGGMAVLTAASREPHRFRRLVLIGIGDAAMGLADRGQADGTVEAEAVARSVEGGATESDRVGQVFHRMVASAGNDPGLVAAFLRRPQPTPTRAALSELDRPVLVMVGSQDFAGPADDLVATLPQARLQIVRGADHFSTTSDFACIDAALQFLDG